MLLILTVSREYHAIGFRAWSWLVGHVKYLGRLENVIYYILCSGCSEFVMVRNMGYRCVDDYNLS